MTSGRQPATLLTLYASRPPAAELCPGFCSRPRAQPGDERVGPWSPEGRSHLPGVARGAPGLRFQPRASWFFSVTPKRLLVLSRGRRADSTGSPRRGSLSPGQDRAGTRSAGSHYAGVTGNSNAEWGARWVRTGFFKKGIFELGRRRLCRSSPGPAR